MLNDYMNSLNPVVLGDIWSGATTMANTMKGKITIVAIAVAAVAMVVGFLFFSFGRNASQAGKEMVKNGLITCVGVTVVAALVATATALAGQGF